MRDNVEAGKTYEMDSYLGGRKRRQLILVTQVLEDGTVCGRRYLRSRGVFAQQDWRIGRNVNAVEVAL